MITKEKAQTLANPYHVKVVEVETLHDGDRFDSIADYIRMKICDENREQNIYVYLGTDYEIVSDKAFYIESKIKNALYNECFYSA